MNPHEEISFLPEDYVEGKLRRRTMFIGEAVVVGLIALVMVMTVRSRNALTVTETAHAETLRDYDQAIAQFNRLCRQHDSQRKIIQHASLARTLIETVPRSNILAEVTNRLPEGASILDLSLDSHPRPDTAAASTTVFDMKKTALEARRKAETLAINDAPDMEVGVKISGLARTDVEVAHYLNELNQSPLFRDVQLVISEAYTLPGKTGATVRRFQIQMTVKADAKLEARPDSLSPITASVEE